MGQHVTGNNTDNCSIMGRKISSFSICLKDTDILPKMNAVVYNGQQYSTDNITASGLQMKNEHLVLLTQLCR